MRSARETTIDGKSQSKSYFEFFSQRAQRTFARASPSAFGGACLTVPVDICIVRRRMSLLRPWRDARSPPARHFCALSCHFRSFRAKVSRLCRRSDRLRCTDAAKVTGRAPNLLGQGIVLADTKTARVLARCPRARSRELRAQRLRLIRALRTDFPLDNAIVMPMLDDVGELNHRLTVRLEDAHVAPSTLPSFSARCG